MSKPAKIYISFEETQQIINKYAGTGELHETYGSNAPQEYIRAGKIIGAYEEHGVYYDTETCMIKYSKRNAHLIPVKPKD